MSLRATIAETAGTTTKPMEARDVHADLLFCGGEPGRTIVCTFAAPGEAQTDPVPWEWHNKSFHDVRGRESEYTLQTAGFEVLRHASKIGEFTDQAEVREAYLREMEEAVQRQTGAVRAIAYDYRMRHLQGGPVRAVHVDLGPGTLPWRMRKALGEEEANQLLRQYRVQAITVWRPLHTVHRDPLALMDARSLKGNELVTYNLRRHYMEPGMFESMGALLPSQPHHRWHYLHEQTAEEPWMIKNRDSEESALANYVPHGSFVDAEYAEHEARRNVEARLFVMFEKTSKL